MSSCKLSVRHTTTTTPPQPQPPPPPTTTTTDDDNGDGRQQSPLAKVSCWVSPRLCTWLPAISHLPNACTKDNITCSQFADDTALITAVQSPRLTKHNLQQAVHSAAKWLTDRQLTHAATVLVTFYHNNWPTKHITTINLNGTQLRAAQQQQSHLRIAFRLLRSITFCFKIRQK